MISSMKRIKLGSKQVIVQAVADIHENKPFISDEHGSLIEELKQYEDVKATVKEAKRTWKCVESSDLNKVSLFHYKHYIIGLSNINFNDLAECFNNNGFKAKITKNRSLNLLHQTDIDNFFGKTIEEQFELTKRLYPKTTYEEYLEKLNDTTFELVTADYLHKYKEQLKGTHYF